VVGHRYRLSRQATADLESILGETKRRFGLLQQRKYADLIIGAVKLVAADPERIGSKPRSEIRAGLRSFRVERASDRRGAASHVLFYRSESLEDGLPETMILRILHDRMDPELHIASDPT
jgi:toxin ParE1/3/4